MIKTVHVRFDGKTFVPDDATGVAVGTTAQITVETANGKPRDAFVEELVNALGGPISWEEGERRLKQLYADRNASIEQQGME